MSALEQGLTLISMPTTSTGLKPFRFAAVNSGGYAAYPAVGAATIGVLMTGTTGSTHHPTTVNVAIQGVAKLAISTASTVAVPDLVMSSSRGSAVAMTAAGIVAGQIISGSSGGAGRVAYVLIAGVNASTATV